MDNSGKDYLVMGSRSGRIFRYTGFEGGNVFSAYTRLDSAYSFILSKNSAYTSYMSAPAIADIDGDGKYEMVIGNVYGGLLMYEQVKSVSIESEKLAKNEISIFPNPAQNEIIIDLKQTISTKTTSVIIYNNIGQQVKKIEIAHNQRFLKLNIEELPNAIYYCKVWTDEGFFNSIFIKQKN
jgi:hypothetical protein